MNRLVKITLDTDALESVLKKLYVTLKRRRDNNYRLYFNLNENVLELITYERGIMLIHKLNVESEDKMCFSINAISFREVLETIRCNKVELDIYIHDKSLCIIDPNITKSSTILKIRESKINLILSANNYSKIAVNKKLLIDDIDSVKYAAIKSVERNPKLASVYFDLKNNTMVSTDRYKLALRKLKYIDIVDRTGFYIPVESLEYVKKLPTKKDIQIKYSNKYVCFTDDSDFKIIYRLYRNYYYPNYPPYKDILDKFLNMSIKKSIILDREAVIEELEKILIKDKKIPSEEIVFSLCFLDSTLTFYCYDLDHEIKNESSVNFDFKHDGFLTMRFFKDIILSTLKVIKTQRIQINVLESDELEPVLIYPINDDTDRVESECLHLAMQTDK